MKSVSHFYAFVLVFLFVSSILFIGCEYGRMPEDRLDDAIERIPKDKLDDALLEAARDGRVLNAKRLLERAANINARDDEHGMTPLHYAARERHISILRLLVENGADVNVRDIHGITAMMNAAIWDTIERSMGFRQEIEASCEIIQLLIDNGADVNARSNRGATALMGATESEHENIDIARLLIANGANVNAIDENGCGALNLVGDPEVIQLLRNAGAIAGEDCSPLLTVIK